MSVANQSGTVYRGRVRGGLIELDAGAVLPEGARVELFVVPDEARDAATVPARSIEQVIAEIVADVPESEWERLPSDLIEQLDHYVYGLPKR